MVSQVKQSLALSITNSLRMCFMDDGLRD